MNITIRKETEDDYQSVRDIITKAFETVEFSDHTEQKLVERLRQSKAFIPELSLVAVEDEIIIGHILVTKLLIVSKSQEHESLALAPVSVLPAHQRNGIGGQLIRHAHMIAKSIGYKSIVLIGHKEYYPRFGYVQADSFGISFPFEAPVEHCFAIKLVENGLHGVSGIVKYPEAFY